MAVALRASPPTCGLCHPQGDVSPLLDAVERIVADFAWVSTDERVKRRPPATTTRDPNQQSFRKIMPALSPTRIGTG
jgi:hypothetical protein